MVLDLTDQSLTLSMDRKDANLKIWKKMENRLFDHERLDLYQTLVEFVILSDEILEELTKG
jgi:hypothetical protein